MMAGKRAHLTPEQIELAEQRKLKKQKQHEVQAPSTPSKAPILSREWVSLLSDQGPRKDEAAFPVKIMTFNLLAQSLIRRESFPTSSQALRVSSREPMIHHEILSHGADILCLQEIDRLEKLLPVLSEAGYSHTYVAGPGKKHGCLIAYAKDKYTKVGDKVVYYDEQEVRHGIDDEKAPVGCSFKTRNIGSLVALKHLKGDGVIVATTHLFWHPSYHYERTRQVGILVRETLKFQTEYDFREWPCFIAGDFNFAPSDPAYQLLVGDALTQDQERCLDLSRVVHVSIDPTVSTVKNTETEAEGGETDPDKIITKARPATPADGLLSTPELVELFSTGAHLRSAYDEGQKALRESGVEIETFGDRCSLPPSKLGAHEPMWTCYTHYWKTVLDYIFVLRPARSRVVLTGYTKPHRTEDIRLGLPQVGICGSDHFSICAEFHIIPEEPRPT